MKCALVIAPYFTNGGYPPLGAAYVNAILRSNRCKVSIFDLCFLLSLEDRCIFDMLKNKHNIAIFPGRVQILLDIQFVLYCLFNRRYPHVDSNILWDSENEKDTKMVLELNLRRYVDKYSYLIIGTEPEIVFFSTYISNMLFTLLLAQRIRELKPNIKLVFGGPGTFSKEVADLIFTLNLGDGIVIRDSEYALAQFLNSYRKSKNFESNIPGFVTPSNIKTNNSIRHHSIKLDELPFPDFSGFPSPYNDFHDYQKNWKFEYRSRYFRNFLLPVQTSRGCTNRCSFCSESMYWNRFNKRNPGSIIREIKHQQKKYGVKSISFNASLINPTAEWHDMFINKIIKDGIEIDWWAFYRPAKYVNTELLKKMECAGCKMVSLGTESFFQPVLDAMNKQITVEENLNILKNLSETSITADYSVLFGFPIRDRCDLTEEYKETIKALNYIKRFSSTDDNLIMGADIVRLEPFSPMYRNHDKYGIIIEKESIELPNELIKIEPIVSEMNLCWYDDVPFVRKYSLIRRLMNYYWKIHK